MMLAFDDFLIAFAAESHGREDLKAFHFPFPMMQEGTINFHQEITILI